MASLFKSFSNLIRGKSQELAKVIGDPVRDGKLAIQDSEKMIGEFTSKIAKLIAQSKRLNRELTEAEAEVNKYQGFAEKAANTGVVEDARRSLELKGDAQRRVDTLKTEIARSDQLIAQLRAQLTKARVKVASAKRNVVNLEARHEGAKIRTELAKASSDFNAGNNPMAALDDLDREVNEKESEAEAWEDLNQEGETDSSLEEKYGGSGNSDVDSELAQLMAKAKA